jgi:hypothetical protein
MCWSLPDERTRLIIVSVIPPTSMRFGARSLASLAMLCSSALQSACFGSRPHPISPLWSKFIQQTGQRSAAGEAAAAELEGLVDGHPDLAWGLRHGSGVSGRAFAV